MSLSIHPSNRLEVLVEHLAGTFAAEPLPAFEREIIVVQSRGMARWLTLQLADRSGLAANLTLPFPATFCRQLAERLATDSEVGPPLDGTTASPYDREPLTWRIFARLQNLEPDGREASETRDRSLTAGASPADYLEDDPDQIKRFQLSTRLAGLFEAYQLFRPRMLLDWESIGDHEAPTSWQSKLWCSIVEDAAPDHHLARRSLDLLDLLTRPGHPPAGLPRRLSVFGASTLPPIVLEILVALARFIPVRIYLLSPTYHFWGELRSEREAARLRQRRRRSADDPPAADDYLEAGHPLLAAFGRQGREFFNLLQEADAEGAAWSELEMLDPGEGSLLRTLQSDVLHLVDRGGPETPPKPIEVGDNSLTIHACHSPMREMEVLRDQLLAAFDADPELQPSDVLVMVPRIGDYAPYVEAAFGVATEGTPLLPLAIADRETGDERPAADTLLRLLSLVSSRVTPSAVLGLLDVVPVRRAFGVASAEVSALRLWVRDIRIRWGMDGEQRAADFAVPDLGANTWRAGLDRLLMGYAAGDGDRLVAGVAPSAGATAGNVELLGRLAAFVETIFSHLRRLRDPRPATAWAADLRSALADVYQAAAEEEDSALEWVLGVLEELHQAAIEEPLSRQVVLAHLKRRLATEGSASGFLDGRITFCAVKPMRNLPFKVICIAGLTEGAFPRRDPRLGFDLMATAPCPGDRSLAEDDRYLFLETLLAAGSRLILTYEGRSQKDNSPRAPSAVISELLATLDRAFVTSDGRPIRQQVLVDHRLHSWSSDYFGAGEDPRLFSYSRESLQLARCDRRRPAAMPFVAEGGAAAKDAEGAGDSELEIELPELIDLWVNPARHYCRKVLRLTLGEHSESHDAEPFDVDFLDRYQISQWLLERRLRGEPVDEGPIDERPGEEESARDEELELLRARGELPLAGLGDAHYRRLARRVDEFAMTLPRHPAREPILIELTGADWRLSGRLEELTDAGALRFRCANLKPKDLVRAWVSHIVFAVWQEHHATELPLLTHLAGIDRAVNFRAVTDAHRILESLIAGYRAGLERPLPVFENASYTFAKRTHRSGGRSKTTPEEAARQAFRGSSGKLKASSPGDLADPYVVLCCRDRDPLAEDGFARWSETLWSPLLSHAEEVRK